MGMLDSHNALCDDFGANEVKYVTKEKKVEHPKENMQQVVEDMMVIRMTELVEKKWKS